MVKYLKEITFSEMKIKQEYLVCDLPDFYDLKLKFGHSLERIIINGTKKKHVKKHIGKYESQDEFEQTFINMHEILTNPDYIGIHPNNGNLQAVKRTANLTLVAVQFNESRNQLEVKTMFPITEAKLEKYLESGNWVDLSQKK